MGDLPRLPGIDYVGAGYDPFLGYANSQYIVATFFDWDEADKNTFTYSGTTYYKPAIISALSQSRSDLESTTGEDIQSYQSSLAASVSASASYLFFSGSLSTEFGEQNLTKSEKSFSRTQQSVSTWSLQVTVTSALRDLLRDGFKTELDNLAIDDASCKNFFQTYGSHLLTGILLGGRALRTASTNKYTVDHSYSLSVTASQSCKFASGQVDAEEKVKYQEAVSSFNSKSDVKSSVIGGDAARAASALTGSNEKWVEWASTVTGEPALIDFAQQPLTPIWTLCATDDKGTRICKALEDYYTNTWAPDRSAECMYRPEFIDALIVISGNDWNVTPPAGYTKITVDLNRNAGGRYVFACYHKQPHEYNTSQQAISDIKVLYDHESTPAGYTKIPNDLNEGAKGKYVYLAYKRDSYDEDTAILDLTAIYGDSSNVQPPYGYTKVDRDLNSGAEGDWIYFAYAKRLRSLK